MAPREFHPRMVLIRPYPLLATLSTLELMAVREYHCPLWVSWPTACQSCFVAWYWSLA